MPSGNGYNPIMAHLRPCRRDDFDGVLALLRQLWPDKPLDPAALRAIFGQTLSSGNPVYLCAAENGTIVGFGSLTVRSSLWQEGNLGHVDELVVDAAHRGRGIGTQLLEGLVALAKAKGCRRIELDSAFHRDEAHRFYEKRGFENRACLFSKIL
jgi:glucosamine-phosphate N-acetyltransferase